MKILITTKFIDKNGWYDYFSENSKSLFRTLFYHKVHYGLRFIRQNVPQIEVLEFPTWEKYCRTLAQGWDVVGFSFHTMDWPRIEAMVEQAKKAGAGQVWGGNYGVLDPVAAPHFDKIFTGYCEHKLAALVGHKIGRLRHPPLVDQWYIRPFPVKVQRVGIIQTQRGCPLNCSFCQTPAFAPGVSTVPIESVEEVLAWYRKNGVRWIGVYDEHFGVKKQHTLQVLGLFKKYGLFWTAQTAAATALANLDLWRRHNLMGLGLGVESFDCRALAAWNKNAKTTETVREVTAKLHEAGLYAGGYYILGHEDATFESTLEEIDLLDSLGLDFVQTTILTPFPQTPLWEHLDEKYGIFETDRGCFDTKHLTWNHPHISADQLEKLLHYACLRLNRPGRFFPFMGRVFGAYAGHLGSYSKALALALSFPYNSLRFDENAPYFS